MSSSGAKGGTAAVKGLIFKRVSAASVQKQVGMDARQIQASRLEGSESRIGDLFTLAHIDEYELSAPLGDESESVIGDPMTLTQPEVP
jgi:hypothetical protein